MKYLFYDETIINIDQIIWIKHLGNGCIEFNFKEEIVWYAFCPSHENLLINDLFLFLSKKTGDNSDIYDIQRNIDISTGKIKELF